MNEETYKSQTQVKRNREQRLYLKIGRYDTATSTGSAGGEDTQSR